ncbi:MAG TPA: hypothetical protein DD381_05875 [Lentisphaeria bacterium]|nr:MAG: hypothetical protein A2X47_14230 [Lentisphaerae bacterium GWF2_38_69]HBM15853.1 hypothetical protein [Lentisphaeria bacterium]
MTDRQIEILEASVKLAAKNGVRAMTIKNIASEIGLTEAALYRHFQSKREILLGIIQLFSLSSQNDFKAISMKNPSALSELKKLILRRIEQFEHFPEIAYIMLSLDIFMQDEELRVSAAESIHKHKEFILSLILKGQEKNEIRSDSEPKELFRIVLGSFRLLLTQWFLNKYQFSLKDEFESLWKTLETVLKNNSL